MCRWLDPVVFVFAAAYDSLDVERLKSSSDKPRKDGNIDWEASGDTRLSPWNPRQWARLFLGFHGWRKKRN